MKKPTGQTPDETEVFRQWVADIRTDFHRHPELSGQEIRTTQKIRKILTDLGIQATIFDDITGAVGLIRGKAPGPCLAIRADIDALPLDEVGGRPHGSTIPGAMHACGHDANTAIVLGLARKLKDTGLDQQINGSVKLIFQPSEEKLGGALNMINQGVLDNPKVNRIIAGHMDPNFPVGQVAVFSRLGHAASLSFTLKVQGKGAHGARPHMGINPITVGAAFVSGLDGLIQRQVPPSQSAVISVGSFNSGQAGNVIPEIAMLAGSIRTHNLEIENKLKQALTDLAAGVGTVFNAHCNLVFKEGAPLGLNDPDVCNDLKVAAWQVVGKENVHVLPFIMGSEDFYYFTQKCPGAMMRFGCACENDGIIHPLHSPKFDLHKDALAVGVDTMLAAVKAYFKLE
ncbi:peptidase (M20/M25/M40 family protein) [Desulforapulum autotrophicum HRM2]|uniref:Peptidase (M20/M25/M40 family protein) n=1 Tax=Desulforapulum autotrophicum (strain ATCC 43914 / DSM 3382 / VKM B-1955 / HRM2) TaxID=177437 RepID=C0Q8R6_DESAH|nr:M20 family metallopeptidase [Desulforapulum autotrophicum]ACN14406.1 peptidase (M20/M25/M40 family protein) [Desulforapulum autotrophicum HRM2]